MLEYLEAMDGDVNACVAAHPVTTERDGWMCTRHELLAKHVVVWHLQRDGFRA